MLRFPHGMRPSAVSERRQFYSEEFDIGALTRWIGDRPRSIKFAMIPGRHTGIVAPEHVADKDNVVVIDNWSSAKDVRDYAIDYAPEGLYYDRNRYVDVRTCTRCSKDRRACLSCHNYIGQQLAFDIDPENVDCPYHGHIGRKMQDGRGLSFCMFEFKAVRKQAAALSLEISCCFERVGVVYSGRGFHVVVDDEPAYLLTKRERIAFAKSYGKRYSIDEWVTAGGSRLMRLPNSLNGLVSRKCMTIKEIRDLKEFDPRTSKLALPEFVRSP